MERRSRKRSSSAGSEKMERVGNRKGKMEKYCSTGQSPQRVVAPTESSSSSSSSSRMMVIMAPVTTTVNMTSESCAVSVTKSTLYGNLVTFLAAVYDRSFLTIVI
jgi:hypothetical protein